MNKKLLLLLMLFISSVMSLEEPRGIKRKVSDISTLSEQDQIARAQRATQELITLIKNYNDLTDIKTFNRINHLLEHGADPNAKDINNQPLLLIAIRKNQKELVEALLNSDANPDIQDNNLNSPLLEASRHNWDDIVSMLLRFGANPNIKNNNGDTPLRMALETRRIAIVHLLLQAGADPSIKNNTGNSAYSLLTFLLDRSKLQNKKTEVVSLLEIKKWFDNPETLPKTGFERIK